MLVLDLEANDGTLTAADVASLKEKPQGGRRLVLCYLSVGEAATYPAVLATGMAETAAGLDCRGEHGLAGQLSRTLLAA